MRILVVEDQRRVGEFVEKALAEHNYDPSLVATCSEAREALSAQPYGAVVLDLGLPDGDGLELLRSWRDAGHNVPVLIVSARDQVEDRVLALNGGADDYLAKPFSIDELIARLRSVLRRTLAARSPVLTHGAIRLDVSARTAVHHGAPVYLSNREFRLLEVFLQHAGRTLTRTFITEKVWGANYDLGTNLIEVYVRRLRGKFEQPGDAPLIRTIRGTGYVLA